MTSNIPPTFLKSSKKLGYDFFTAPAFTIETGSLHLIDAMVADITILWSLKEFTIPPSKISFP